MSTAGITASAPWGPLRRAGLRGDAQPSPRRRSRSPKKGARPRHPRPEGRSEDSDSSPHLGPSAKGCEEMDSRPRTCLAGCFRQWQLRCPSGCHLVPESSQTDPAGGRAAATTNCACACGRWPGGGGGLRPVPRAPALGAQRPRRGAAPRCGPPGAPSRPRAAPPAPANRSADPAPGRALEEFLLIRPKTFPSRGAPGLCNQ
ncbi:uncharacterized protein [Vicugna pacos]|uniref:Uncharacterized protein n=1 Tax=Vicugna pacos TaxID=30538 RepID=A0ABM5EHX6_VICPA